MRDVMWCVIILYTVYIYIQIHLYWTRYDTLQIQLTIQIEWRSTSLVVVMLNQRVVHRAAKITHNLTINAHNNCGNARYHNSKFTMWQLQMSSSKIHDAFCDSKSFIILNVELTIPYARATAFNVQRSQFDFHLRKKKNMYVAHSGQYTLRWIENKRVGRKIF